jgi:hypothetical protein
MAQVGIRHDQGQAATRFRATFQRFSVGSGIYQEIIRPGHPTDDVGETPIDHGFWIVGCVDVVGFGGIPRRENLFREMVRFPRGGGVTQVLPETMHSDVSH